LDKIFKGRIKAARMALALRKLGALLVTDIHNIRYLSGFTGSSAYVVITPERGYFFTDSRYLAQAGAEVKALKVRQYKLSGLEEVAGFLKKRGRGPVGFDGSGLSHAHYLRLRRAVRPLKLKSAPGVVCRLVKDAPEIEFIKASARLLDTGFTRARRLLRAGAFEDSVAFTLEVGLRKRGADGLAFDTIVASGARGALPHGKASRKRIRKGELVVLDMGVLLDGYNSDETRTFSIGPPTRRQREVHGAVKDAQSRAIDKIRAGVPVMEVDKAARGSIRKAGYAKFFTHATGHGVGLEVHEAPAVGPSSKGELVEGMVITVEPGIYIPGWGGVRIEDMALVRSDGCELLTNSSRELFSL
jgi:Xaa-Pro aminopeptidase